MWKVLAIVVSLLTPNANGDRLTERYWSNESWATFAECEAARKGDSFVEATADLWDGEKLEHAPMTVLEPTTECKIPGVEDHGGA